MKKYISLLLVIMIMCMPITSFANPLTDTITNVVEKGTNVAKDIAVKTVENGADTIKKVTNFAVMSIADIIKAFTDIATHWAKNFIAQLVKDGVVSGYPDGTFRPDANIKVSEFTVLVLKANNIEIEKAEGVWYQGVVNTAINHGIIKKSEFNNYDRYINRGEMTRMIIRALGEIPSTGKTNFADDSQIPSHLKGYVKKAVELGIIGGYPDNTFKPYGNATRAESTVVIQKMRDIKNGTLKPNEPKPPIEEKPVVTDPVPITKMPQRLYDMKAKSIFSDSTDIKELNKMVDEMSGMYIKQSKDFIPIYYGFNYKDYSDFKDKCKYYMAGKWSYKDEDEILFTDEYLDKIIQDRVKNEIIQEARFFTEDKLVYINERGDTAVRGIMQFRYLSGKNLPSGVEVGKWYEQDVEILWYEPLLNPQQNNWKHTDSLYCGIKFISQPREIK
ncbi:S-layer homology domain-containing protein [Crassaminicella thermophila]|nr:S-layer homology domain-containing protein [Crassaminicella thermophila]